MKLIYFLLALILAVVTVVSIAGFRGDHSTRPPLELFPDMNYQDKVKDQVTSSFFADGMASRSPVEGTVALEMPAQNDYWATGKWDSTHWGNGIPVHAARDGTRALQIDALNMSRGRERYTINCQVCHGAAGDGKGIVSKYGLNGAANYQTDPIRQMTDGEIFNTITNGKEPDALATATISPLMIAGGSLCIFARCNAARTPHSTTPRRRNNRSFKPR